MHSVFAWVALTPLETHRVVARIAERKPGIIPTGRNRLVVNWSFREVTCELRIIRRITATAEFA
jgi:hypothetical protein